MILLNFSHPLSADQLTQIERLAGKPVEKNFEIPVQFDNDQPFVPQLKKLVDLIPLDAQQLQTAEILITPPSLNFITALILAELHGRMGYFPPLLRLRPVAGSLPPRYEVAEALNLQEIRDAARPSRYK